MEYDASIDPNNLDEESVYVPGAFDVFSRAEAEASQKWDSLKDKMKIIQADIELDLRGWPLERINSFFQKSIDKLTESVYKSLVLVHPEVIELYQETEQARYETKIYEAARKSIERKAEGLDRLARLHGQGYFMKIEGRPYKKFEVDAVLERVKRTIMRRGDVPGFTAPAPAAAPSLPSKKTAPVAKAKPEPKRVPPKVPPKRTQ